MSFSRVAIVGLGLLGGSIGLAVAENLTGCTTTGFDAYGASNLGRVISVGFRVRH